MSRFEAARQDLTEVLHQWTEKHGYTLKPVVIMEAFGNNTSGSVSYKADFSLEPVPGWQPPASEPEDELQS
jgi:hypothetical protein